MGPLEIKDWSVSIFTTGSDGSRPPDRSKAISRWTSPEIIKRAASSEDGKAVLDDAPNITDEILILSVRGGLGLRFLERAVIERRW